MSPRTKAVVVTGASSGIGEACAVRFDQAGFRVFAGVRRQSDGDALKRRCSDRLCPLFLDVTDPASIAAAAESVKTALASTGLAGLVNNAGITAPGPLEFVPISDLRRILDVNVVGQIGCTQAFLPLIRQGQGRIVFMSSLAGRVASPLTGGSYCGSKFALEALADVLRMELQGSGIPVSIIEPGPVVTPIWKKGLTAADEMLEAIPEEGRGRYAHLIGGVRVWAERSTTEGIAMDDVTAAVFHAVTSERPKTRYAVGRGSRLFLLSRFLPDRLRDRLFLRALGA